MDTWNAKPVPRPGIQYIPSVSGIGNSIQFNNACTEYSHSTESAWRGIINRTDSVIHGPTPRRMFPSVRSVRSFPKFRSASIHTLSGAMDDLDQSIISSEKVSIYP
ncbi:hypothetical protein T310_0022 [Rasamsonia emersonii CBS 393.64]|uniref:Uncharacterized protein n=1 Tax=Rasamsonia emersonii (strain ATCC 16479 / CBS 393.64 / IMI 116815) TaxID=1408163 RepID=A0A0F4Z7T6_RASE3|nr:hypothetical protein T310_0022 [Rasamsonia emersonii CBS 393.64]KKA25928.1 hypothetical protein T310_0022 [Rasamsonia emersonii CBS 393.64]